MSFEKITVLLGYTQRAGALTVKFKNVWVFNISYDFLSGSGYLNYLFSHFSYICDSGVRQPWFRCYYPLVLLGS